MTDLSPGEREAVEAAQIPETTTGVIERLAAAFEEGENHKICFALGYLAAQEASRRRIGDLDETLRLLYVSLDSDLRKDANFVEWEHEGSHEEIDAKINALLAMIDEARDALRKAKE